MTVGMGGKSPLAMRQKSACGCKAFRPKLRECFQRHFVLFGGLPDPFMGGLHWLATCNAGRKPEAEQLRLSFDNQGFMKRFSGLRERSVHCGKCIKIHSCSPTKDRLTIQCYAVSLVYSTRALPSPESAQQETLLNAIRSSIQSLMIDQDVASFICVLCRAFRTVVVLLSQMIGLPQ